MLKHSFLFFLFLFSFGCSNPQPFNKSDLDDGVLITRLLKNYKDTSVQARSIFNKYHTPPEINVWLTNVLSVGNLLRKPPVDVYSAILGRETDFKKLKNYIESNWVGVRQEDKPVISAYLKRMSALFRQMHKINDRSGGKVLLVSEYLRTGAQLYTALTGKL